MANIQSFSTQRVLLLIQKELYENLKIVSVGYISFFGIAAAIIFFNSLSGGGAWSNFSNFYTAGLYLTGIFISGMAFNAFRSKEGTMNYLVVPASILEKFLSVFILTTIGLVAFYTTVFTIFDSLFIIIGNTTTGSSIELFRYFDNKVPEVILNYFIIQSVFLAGASMFKKVPLFFTVFWLFVVSIGIALFSVLLGLIVKETLDTATFAYKGSFNLNFTNQADPGFWLKEVPRFIFYYISAPVFWAITYFKIKEKEA